MNICQSNNYRKDLSWLPFDNEPRVQERQQVKKQQSCISVILRSEGVQLPNDEVMKNIEDRVGYKKEYFCSTVKEILKSKLNSGNVVKKKLIQGEYNDKVWERTHLMDIRWIKINKKNNKKTNGGRETYR